jgi:hypothetical protein
MSDARQAREIAARGLLLADCRVRGRDDTPATFKGDLGASRVNGRGGFRATTLRFFPRGPSALARYLGGQMAMMPVMAAITLATAATTVQHRIIL